MASCIKFLKTFTLVEIFVLVRNVSSYKLFAKHNLASDYVIYPQSLSFIPELYSKKTINKKNKLEFFRMFLLFPLSPDTSETKLYA